MAGFVRASVLQRSTYDILLPKQTRYQAALQPFDAPDGSRTHKNKEQILSLPRLPIPPQEQVLVLLVRLVRVSVLEEYSHNTLFLR